MSKRRTRKACEERYIYIFVIPLRSQFAVQVPVAACRAHRVCTKSAEAATHSGKKQGRGYCVCVYLVIPIEPLRQRSLESGKISICSKRPEPQQHKSVRAPNLCRRDKCERLLHFRGRAAFFCCQRKRGHTIMILKGDFSFSRLMECLWNYLSRDRPRYVSTFSSLFQLLCARDLCSRLPHPAEYAHTHFRSRHREADGWMGFDDACVCVCMSTQKKTTRAREMKVSMDGWMDGCRERIHLHDLFISRTDKPLSLCIITTRS